MLSATKVQEILNTLPIGFYLGTSLECRLNPTGNMTFYNPTLNYIEIGYNTIPDLDKLADTDPQIENYVRCLLYHEISHVILTPKSLEMTPVINVFEDERIETIFSTYFHRVNFKKFVKLVNKFHEDPPKTAWEMYYDIVRFDFGPKELIQEKNEIILEYSYLSAFPEGYRSCVDEYMNAIKAFYKRICDLFDTLPKESGSSEKSEESEESEESEKSKDSKSSSDSSEKAEDSENSEDSEESEESGFDRDPSTASEDGSGEFAGGAPAAEMEMADESDDEKEVEEMLSKAFSEDALETLVTNLKYAIENTVKKYTSANFTNRAETIILNSARKKRLQSNGARAYSGKIDPKSIRRPGRTEDYKWWIKKNPQGDKKMFDKLHINLFCDVSGSFWASKVKINQAIQTLSMIEKKHPDFDLTVIHMGNTNRIAPKENRIVDCHEGNWLTNDILDIYKKVQRPDATNYNIVVFDGDAQSFDGAESERASLRAKNKKAFTAWNHPNCVIISDPDNERYFRGSTPNAKVIYTRSYVSELEDNIIKALTILFK